MKINYRRLALAFVLAVAVWTAIPVATPVASANIVWDHAK